MRLNAALEYEKLRQEKDSWNKVILLKTNDYEQD